MHYRVLCVEDDSKDYLDLSCAAPERFMCYQAQTLSDVRGWYFDYTFPHIIIFDYYLLAEATGVMVLKNLPVSDTKPFMVAYSASPYYNAELMELGAQISVVKRNPAVLWAALSGLFP